MSQAKRSSIQSKKDSIVTGSNKSLIDKKDGSVEVSKSGGTTSAFQRLVQASKRMMQNKKSSEKKDPNGFKKLQAETAMAARSNSQCTDTISIMNE